MVTIEQKLSIFNKLLERSMSDRFAAEMDSLKKDCQVLLQQSNQQVDLEVRDIERKSARTAEKESSEILNRAAARQRKSILSTKEELFSTLLAHLKNKVDEFILSEDYKAYLIHMAKQLDASEEASAHIAVYMTAKDLERHGPDVAAAMPDLLAGGNPIRTAEENILGGMILVDSGANTRIDLSIRTLLEENKPMMMELFFGALSAPSIQKESKANE